jgi:hypothetical protein
MGWNLVVLACVAAVVTGFAPSRSAHSPCSRCLGARAGCDKRARGMRRSPRPRGRLAHHRSKGGGGKEGIVGQHSKCSCAY